MKVKWNGETSGVRTLNGGGPQGGLMGILEYLSQTNDNVNFIPEEDRFKFIDDLSLLEIINLISLGLSSYNCRLHVPSDINIEHNQYLPPQNIHTPNYLDDIMNNICLPTICANKLQCLCAVNYLHYITVFEINLSLSLSTACQGAQKKNLNFMMHLKMQIFRTPSFFRNSHTGLPI